MAPNRMLREFANLVEAVSVDLQLVLVVEDVHWSDESTVDLVSILAQRPERARALLVVTYRPAEAAALNHPLRRILTTLRGRQLCTDIALEYLSRREARVWALIDEWEKREREAGPNLLIAQHTKGGGSEGTWESESKPVVMGKRDILQGASIVALYSQLDKITHTRMQLLKLMEPAEDKSVDTTMMLVIVNDRKDVKPIMDATSFQRILAPQQAIVDIDE